MFGLRCLDSHWQFACVCASVCMRAFLCQSVREIYLLVQLSESQQQVWDYGFALILRWADAVLLKPYQIQKLLFCIILTIHLITSRPSTWVQAAGMTSLLRWILRSCYLRVRWHSCKFVWMQLKATPEYFVKGMHSWFTVLFVYVVTGLATHQQL